MTATETFVIVGASLAGAKAAEALREQGFDGQVILVGAEAHHPYERPPLSKGYLAESTARAKVFVHAEDWYSENQVELRLGQTVSAIDPAGHRVELADGTSLGYDKLLLTTGSSPRVPGIPGADAQGVHYLRTLDDSDALRALLKRASRLVVIGAGWIGLEVTAAARQAGVEVTVVEAAELPLLRVLGPEVAEMFAELHRRHGVRFRFNVTVAEIVTKDGHATGVQLGDGSVLDADAVLVAVGAAPNVQLAQAAGLDVDNGVLVDSALRTSDPDIYAAGDIANALHPLLGTRVRVEHWANALNQPAVAAASMRGSEAAYTALPYFFTDQYDLGMEYVGYLEPGGYDEVVFRGELASGEYVAFWRKDGRVLAGMNVNVWDVTDPIKALIGSQVVIDAARLSDTSVSLEELAADVSSTGTA